MKKWVRYLVFGAVPVAGIGIGLGAGWLLDKEPEPVPANVQGDVTKPKNPKITREAYREYLEQFLAAVAEADPAMIGPPEALTLPGYDASLLAKHSEILAELKNIGADNNPNVSRARWDSAKALAEWRAKIPAPTTDTEKLLTLLLEFQATSGMAESPWPGDTFEKYHDIASWAKGPFVGDVDGASTAVHALLVPRMLHNSPDSQPLTQGLLHWSLRTGPGSTSVSVLVSQIVTGYCLQHLAHVALTVGLSADASKDLRVIAEQQGVMAPWLRKAVVAVRRELYTSFWFSTRLALIGGPHAAMAFDASYGDGNQDLVEFTPETISRQAAGHKLAGELCDWQGTNFDEYTTHLVALNSQSTRAFWPVPMYACKDIVPVYTCRMILCIDRVRQFEREHKRLPQPGELQLEWGYTVEQQPEGLTIVAKLPHPDMGGDFKTFTFTDDTPRLVPQAKSND